MKLINTLAAAAVIDGSFFLVPTPAEAFWWNNKSKQEQRSPSRVLNHKKMITEYHANETRFSRNWVWYFIKHTGEITDLGSQHVRQRITFYNTSRNVYAEMNIFCDIDVDDISRQSDKIASVDRGDTVTVNGRLKSSRDFRYHHKSGKVIYGVRLSECRIS